MYFLQIWIVPAPNGSTSRYQQQHYSEGEKRGQLRLSLSPYGESGSLTLNPDVRVFAGLFDGIEQAQLPLDDERYVYVHVASGSLTINGHRLKEGDGMRNATRRQTCD